MAFIGAGQSDTLRYDLKGKRPRGPRRMCAKVTLEPFTGSSVGYRFGADNGMSVYGAPEGLADFGFSPARAGGHEV